MDTRTLALSNLETGEIYGSADVKLKDDRYIARGYRMYNTGVEFLINNLSRKELLVTLGLYGAETVDYHNVLMKPFSKLTSELDTASRSRLKKKLLELGVIGECNGKIMLNPFLFIPKGDKNIKNCMWFTQRAWKYLFNDMNAVDDQLESYVEHVFGKTAKKPTKIKIKDQWYGTS